MLSSMKVLSFPSKYVPFLTSCQIRAGLKHQQHFGQKGEMHEVKRQENAQVKPSPLWDSFTSCLGIQLQSWGKICVAQQISVLSSNWKKGKLCFFLLSDQCLLSTMRWKYRRDNFPHCFLTVLYKCIYFGAYLKKLAEIFLLHLFIALKRFGSLIMNKVPGGHQLDNTPENVASTNWFTVEGQHRLMCECKGTVRK